MMERFGRGRPISRREFLWRAAGTSLAMLAMGATQLAAPAKARAQTPAQARPKRGGTFVTLAHTDISSLSPDDSAPVVHAVLVNNIHEGLVRIDEHYNIVPRLAESYRISPDGTVYHFKLRHGVKWHDGRSFTAEDVKYTYEWVLNPNNATAGGSIFRVIRTIDTPDPYTVAIRLEQPSAPFLIHGATKLMIPKHHHGKIGEEEFRRNPIGTGPYRFRKQEAGKNVLLEAFDEYWDGRPWMRYFREDVVPEPSARALALETGKADSNTVFLEPEDILRFMNHPGLQHFIASGTQLNHFALNHLRPIFREKRVRQAMMYALDRDAMVKDLLKGLAVTATANLSPAIHQYYEPNVKQYDRNPARAKTLLAEAGWKPGPDGMLANAAGERFSVVCDILQGDSVRRKQAEMARQNFRDVGIEMQVREVESSAFWRAGLTGKYDMALFNWTHGGFSGDPDAGRSLSCDGLNNRSKWCNQEAERLLEEGAKATAPEKRRQIYSDLQKLVAEEVPFLFVSFWDTVLLFNKHIKGLPQTSVSNPYALYWMNSHKYWIEE